MRPSRLICPILVAIFSLISASENVKRAPSGFQGVRGKKSIQDSYPETAPAVAALASPNSNTASNGVVNDALNEISQIDVPMDKRAPSAGFHGMRGKKIPFTYEGYPYPYPPLSINDVMLLPKRAPMGFMGMRGKKEMEMVGDEYDKRAPNMGFLGMRGKKMNEDEDNFNDYMMDKRAPNMGFLGMRGKKEYAPYFEEDKRAPAAGFFGMRGKKQPARSSFFGMRGKKYPYEFRGKFVGVRGKKDSSENMIPENLEYAPERYATDLDLNELMLLLSEGQQDGSTWEKRKGPSGFLGMRG